MSRDNTSIGSKIIFRGPVLVALLVVGNACGKHNTCDPHANLPAIKIGASLDLSGANQADGLATKAGYDLWVKNVNADGGVLCRQIQLEVMDDASDLTQTSANYETMISTHHDDLVVGPWNDPPTIAAAQVALSHGYALINATGTGAGDFQMGLTNFFCVSLPAAATLTTFASWVLSLPNRPKSAVYASSDQSYNQSMTSPIITALEQGGITTAVPEITYPADGTDAGYADLVIAADAGLVIIGSNAAPDAVVFVNEFIAKGYNPAILLEESGPDQGTAFSSAIGGNSFAEGILVPNGAWYPGIRSFGEADFEATWVTQFGGTAADIPSDTVQGYSVMQVLQQAAEKIGSIDNTALMQELRSDTFQSLQGPVKFAADGENSLAIAVVYQWQNGTAVPIYPPQSATAVEEYPKPNWP